MFKVYRRGCVEDGLPFPCQLLAARPSPRGSQLLPPPRRLRQFGFRKKHTRTQACELPTQPSVGFLLAGRSGRSAVRERRSDPRPCFSLPGFVPQRLVDELGRLLLSVLASTCARLWHEFRQQILHGLAAVSPRSLAWVAVQSCQGPAALFGHQCAGQGSNTLCWALWHSWAPHWSSFFYQEHCLHVFLAIFLPKDSRAIFQSAGAGVTVPVSSSGLRQWQEMLGEGDDLPRAPSTLLACTGICSLGLSGMMAVKRC